MENIERNDMVSQEKIAAPEKNNGSKPGVFSRKIVNSHGIAIGFLKHKTIYKYVVAENGEIDYDKRAEFWFSVVVDDDTKTYELFDYDRRVYQGFIDYSDNLLDPAENYMGTLVRNNPIWIFLLILLISTGLSMYFASYFINPERNVPVGSYSAKLDVTQYADKRPWSDIYDAREELDIFHNSQYNGERIICPGSMESYGFVVENGSESELKFSISFSDENEKMIPMQYKLRLGNAYIVGDENTWVSVEELRAEHLISLGNSSLLFTLEWWWNPNISDPHDTEIGSAVRAEAVSYVLKITVSSDEQ